MKMNEIYKQVLALTLETPSDNEDYKDFVVPVFNLLSAELFHHNNIARERNGKLPLATPAKVYSLTDDNPLEWQFDAAAVYGLAAKLLTGDEHGLEGTFQQQYYALLADALKAQWEQVGDVYASSSD